MLCGKQTEEIHLPQYQAMFVRVDGLDEEDLGSVYRLNAANRDEAEDEALELPRPEGSNFIKLTVDGRVEWPMLGFDL